MKYLIVQDWPDTHGNHAGMLHMCNLLKARYPEDYEVIVKSSPNCFNFLDVPHLRRLRKIVRRIYEEQLYPLIYHWISRKMYARLREGDKVFLLEYMFPKYPQIQIAQKIKSQYSGVRVFGLTHLTVPTLQFYGCEPEPLAKEWQAPVDKLMTLGSSLSRVYLNCGIPQEKIFTGFHYVDLNYYRRTRDFNNERLRVVTLGRMARNYDLLLEIVKALPDIDWHICVGNSDKGELFGGLTNVTLYGYLPEEELKQVMEASDVVLSVMKDTIGSNVITTSLALGLAQVVSDVGSIRDYCTEDDSVFCQNTKESFVSALQDLVSDRRKVEFMKEAAKIRSAQFSIEKVHEWFSKI